MKQKKHCSIPKQQSSSCDVHIDVDIDVDVDIYINAVEAFLVSLMHIELSQTSCFKENLKNQASHTIRLR